MMKCSLRWIWAAVFSFALVGSPIPVSKAGQNDIVLLLNEVGEIVTVDLAEGKGFGKISIPDTYHANTIIADPNGRYILVGGGSQLVLFLDPKSMSIKNGLRPAIPRLPWEKSWDGYKQRLSGFTSVYEGNWAITPNGDKIYFSGRVPQLQPTIVIDPFAYTIKEKIDSFIIYPKTLFSRDGKSMFINHRKTRDILIIDTNSEQIIKRIAPPPEYGEFNGGLLHLDGVGGLLLVISSLVPEGGHCLVRVDTNSGEVTNVMNDPFEGKQGDCAITSSGRYFVYNEYISVQHKSYSNVSERVYTGKINIVDLQTMSRKTLSLQEKYPSEQWNLASKCYMVPDQEKALFVIVGKVIDFHFNPRLSHQKLLQPFHLLLVDLRTARIEKSIKVPDGGFKKLTFFYKHNK